MYSVMETRDLRSMIEHVFLPPKLPQMEDEPLEASFVTFTVEALRAFQEMLGKPSLAVQSAINAVTNLQVVNGSLGGKTCDKTLLALLSRLEDGDMLPVKIHAQNAALLISRLGDKMNFEGFELSARNHDVVTTKGRLTRWFPGVAVEVDIEAVLGDRSDFFGAISHTIGVMSRDAASSMRPKSHKKGHKHSEGRDTNHPGLVSELLIGGILGGLGTASQVTCICKQTRDDVLWNDALSPWRRSPMWLLIRVAIQLVMMRSSDGSRDLYKEFMVFFMNMLLGRACGLPLESDIFYVMNAKICRRLRKLDRSQGHNLDSLRKQLRQTLQASSNMLNERWREIQAREATSSLHRPIPPVDLTRDAYVETVELDKYIEWLRREEKEVGRAPFSASSKLLATDPDVLPQLPNANAVEFHYAVSQLQQVERWVSEHLISWVEDHDDSHNMYRLLDMLTQYHKLARSLYDDNAEGMSIMLLTIFEMWLACDKLGTSTCSLLREYDPDIWTGALENLLLPSTKQLERLDNIERYIDDRKESSKFPVAHLFDLEMCNSFASRFFDSSPVHQNLHSVILARAEKERDAKLAEFERKSKDHANLTSQAKSLEHEIIEVVIDQYQDYREVEKQHLQSCRRCRLEKQAAALSIRIHEWPLPEDVTEMKSVVFELQVPDWFANWRDARQYLMSDVLCCSTVKYSPQSAYHLSSGDPHLSKSYYREQHSRRIGLLSEHKPHIVTHYREKVISETSKHDICLRNGLTYRYYDSIHCALIGTMMRTDEIPLACTYRLPHKSQLLQKYLFRPSRMPHGIAPNLVIARQDECPSDMTVEEYKDLATIPLGFHVQWSNILVQLAMPEVDFKKAETWLVISQCLYQAGPRGGSPFRTAHLDCRDEAFARLIIEKLFESLTRVQENWELLHALGLFVDIATRVLCLNHGARTYCLSFLDEARNVAMDWMRTLHDRARSARDPSNRSDFMAKRTAVALVCGSTFDVDEQTLESIIACPTKASALIQCAVAEHQAWSERMDSDTVLKLLRLRFKRMLYRTRKFLSTIQDGLDDALPRIWSGYVPGPNGWTSMPSIGDEWLFNVTTPKGAVTPIAVHYNMLSGELLVDGAPLDRPPTAYREQSLYRTLFGDDSVEIVATSAITGFSYSLLQRFNGTTVYLGMPANSSGSPSRLRVRATDGTKTCDVIPAELLEDVYPTHFVEEYVHWYDLQTEVIEFRPKKTPWKTACSVDWSMSRSESTGRWRLQNDTHTISGLKTPLSRAITSVLDPLALPTDIHVKLQALQVEVVLPKLRLGFTMDDSTSRLVSKEFPSLQVARDQSPGVFVGLRNKLMLESSTGEGRRILVLGGSVSHSWKDGHVTVEVCRESARIVYALDLDADLRRLLDNGNISCKLFIAHIHALTSFCLPDPFTGMTGTEQALTTLQSAAVRSFERLHQEDTDRLGLIARLAPRRTYYPPGKRVMQRVTWDPRLGCLSQHGGLYAAVCDIFDHARRVAVLQPGSLPRFPNLTSINPDLTDRDRIRTSTFRVSGFGAEDHTTSEDQRYDARDRAKCSIRSYNAARLSSFLAGSRNAVPVRVASSGYLWSAFARTDSVVGSNAAITSRDLTYCTDHLEDGRSFVLQNWLAIHRWAKTDENARGHRFALTCWMSAMAFSETADMELLQALAFCISGQATLSPQVASVNNFSPRRGIQCTKLDLRAIIKQHLLGFNRSPESHMARNRNEPKGNFHRRRQLAFHAHQETAIALYVDAFLSQWPLDVPYTPTVHTHLDVCAYCDTARITEDVRLAFTKWHENRLLFEYLEGLERKVSLLPHNQSAFDDLTVHPAVTFPSAPGLVTVQDLFSKEPPELPIEEECFAAPVDERQDEVTKQARDFRLHTFISTLGKSNTSSEYERQYNRGLEVSLAALVDYVNESRGARSRTTSMDVLSRNLERCEGRVATLFETIERLLTTSIASTSDIFIIENCPRIRPLFLAQQLCRHRWIRLSLKWQVWIVGYGLAVTDLQRAKRLIALASSQEDLLRELENRGHTNWNPHEYPESLLMEIESGLLIREVQENVAAQMRDPPSGGNSTMQLHMGEGKTSMIVPMVVAAVGDGFRLARVIVAKPQSRQMSQMLVAKLGGLVDRRVYFMPISRDLRLDISAASEVAALIEECISSGGVLLVQPEHVLSLQLMVSEAQLAGDESVSTVLLSILAIFRERARDIVDESDENFSTKFELIYTMGKQQMIEHSPDRWYIVQQVLDVVRETVPAVAQMLPQSISLEKFVPGGFPRVRLLRPDAGSLLVKLLTQRICDHSLCGLPIGTQSRYVRHAICDYISMDEPPLETIQTVEESTFWTASTKPVVLLLRGLLARGILTFVLGQKRWRVNYGLTVRSPATRLAVPYRALDSPSPRSEFSHPDVVIVLTSLTHYYEGLTLEDFIVAVGDLLKSDDAGLEYHAWLRDAPDVPSSLRQVQSINLDDHERCVERLFRALRHAKSVVDYFLSRHVFAKEMREFPSKLSASGWDLGRKSEQILTGFSGTCDSRHVNPLHVDHVELPTTQHTNALVLEYLLQPVNGVHLMCRTPREITEADHLLVTATSLDPPVEVILDVGAQVLELTNSDFAAKWLALCEDAHKQAAIFVNDKDEICVIDRAQRVELLQVSPFVSRTEACLVFLDEAHTRGIDLRLPREYRALVTLGPRLTKDRLVQACMRLRKLGHGQTVVFCIPEEIQSKIRREMLTSAEDPIQLVDVLRWSVLETHEEIRRSMPLWAVQGDRFARHAPIWEAAFANRAHISFQGLLEDEAQSLEARYRPCRHSTTAHQSHHPPGSMQHQIALRCQQFDNLHLAARNLQEEQEKELSPETEQEQQIQRAPPADPAEHVLHADVKAFAMEGTLVSGSPAYMPAFTALRDTSIATNFNLSQLERGQEVLVTADFVNCVQRSHNDRHLDLFQRPARWVLTRMMEDGVAVDHTMLISPYEANLLYATMGRATRTTLHLYKPRCNAAYAPIDELDLHAIPSRKALPLLSRSLRVHMNLFAGQLYLSSWEDYVETCKFLGIWMDELTEEMEKAGWTIAADRFILRDGHGRVGGGSTMCESPVHFMKSLMSMIRRGGNSISRTHIGRLLDGQALRHKDFHQQV